MNGSTGNTTAVVSVTAPPVTVVPDKIFLYSSLSLETLTILLLVIASCYTLRAVTNTALLHWNLKVLYLTQALAGYIHTVGRLYGIVAFVAGQSGPAGGAVDHSIQSIATNLSLYMAPLLIGERITATLCYRNYEKSRRRHFIVFLVVAINAWSCAQLLWIGHGITTYTLILAPTSLIACLLSLPVLIGLLRYNQRKYSMPVSGAHRLTERYQVGYWTRF